MTTPLEIKNNLESNIRNSYINSGGMNIRHCGIDMDNIGMLKVRIALDPGTIPAEAVEELVNKTFDSVGVKAFVKSGWNDIRFDHSIPSLVRIEAEGFM